ncbi:signal recognition particle-docking protein FtsY [Kamptonema formosum]|uniref:signal recognition particle-docking protein FtsY n=1 Tax=Kamptonema formosum TaxID=331992 RepID=UPI000344A7AD|nr:signal recognition particle-docking protein FtsY [Oscillatoria sp. PCC 10802]
MAFNWFRREFSDKPELPQEEQARPAAAQPEAAAPAAPPPAQSMAVAEDYLLWAKAAYKNIQKQQQAGEKTAVAAEPPAPEGEAEAESQAAAEPEKAEPAVAAKAVTETEEPASAALVAEPDAAVAETQVLQAEPKTQAPDTAEPVGAPEAELDPALEPAPFWARAEADRQARLERLMATAVETPEPETDLPAAAVPEAPEEEAGLAFDEGFLWSAEVLAAQGRRPDDISIEEITWLKKLRQGLDKTRRSLINQLKAIVGQGPLNQAAVMEIESLLLQADVGVEATEYIIDSLQKKLREEALPPDSAIAYLKKILRDMLDRPTGKSYNPTFAPEKEQLNIWLMTGVNGAGKTTTIGKIAHIAQKSGYRCLIAAADTFRAAAVEQVKIWGQRSGVEVIANPGQNTDPAAVVFDAIAAARSREVQLLLVDTAGRLQNKKNLMEELSKVRRIIDKKAPDAKIESLLVLDATLGQNGLRQAQVFSEVAQLSGVVLTKLDGTAKGGVALAVVKQLGLPIRFIGAGEGVEDLRPFSSYEFVEALLSG